VRRLDRNDDGRVRYDDFVDGLRPRDPRLEQQVTEKLKNIVVTRDRYEALKSHEDEHLSKHATLTSNKKVLTSPIRSTAPGSTKVRAEFFSSPKS
jgi:hypothetical protein